MQPHPSINDSTAGEVFVTPALFDRIVQSPQNLIAIQTANAADVIAQFRMLALRTGQSVYAWQEDAGIASLREREMRVPGSKRATDALLQHPLGVTALPDGSIAICDTYNGSIRRYDPATATVSTLATGLAEPSGALVSGGNLVVIESAAHRLTAISLAVKYLDVETREFATQRSATEVAPGKFALQVAFTPPTGQHFDSSFGPATKLSVSAAPSELLLEGSGDGAELTRTLVIGDVKDGVLHVTASAATCDDDVAHAACHLHQQDWGIPVRVVADGVDHLDLMLRGMAERTTT